MGNSAADIKANLLAQYATILNAVFSQVEGQHSLSLMEIEEVALQARAAVGQQVTAALLARPSGQRLPGPLCAQCGQEMRYKGEKQRYVRTRSGDVNVKRAYYYCSRCRDGLFPPR